MIGSSSADPWGNAEVSSEKGVIRIWAGEMGKRDDHPANTFFNAKGATTPVTYVFTRPPVPPKVLVDAEALYKYERRRQTNIDRIEMVVELFPPDRHFSSHRYYMADGMVLRHEQLNADGSTKRVITVQKHEHPRPGPHAAVDDKLLSHKGKALHQVFHRVDEMDRTGKPKLVAMSWNERRRLTPKDDVSIHYAHLVYGTPDGKER